MTGIVKWFDPQKRFGFIVPDDGHAEVFVHSSAILGHTKTLKEKDVVEFDVEASARGPKAARLRILTTSNVTRPFPQNPRD